MFLPNCVCREQLKCSGYCHLSSESLTGQKVKVPCQCTALLSLDGWLRKGYPQTRKERAGWPLIKLKLALQVRCPIRQLSSAGGVVYSKLMPLYFHAPTLSSVCCPSSCPQSLIINPAKTHTAPCSSLFHQHHLFIWPSQRLGSSLTPLPPSPPSQTQSLSPIVLVSTSLSKLSFALLSLSFNLFPNKHPPIHSWLNRARAF